MRVSYSTVQAAPAARKWYWNRAVSRTYFPLELSFHSTPGFAGALDVWSLGDVSISRNVSDGLVYRRHERHLLHEREESFLITAPELSDIVFVQDGREVRGRPGTFLVERSHLPYEFSHAEPNALWVLKIPAATLRARVGQPERLATLTFDATRGIGALFVDMIRLAAPRIDEMDEAARDLTGRHLVDLLALAVEADDRVLGSRGTSVQSAHLQRVERFIRANLGMSGLAPQMIADACGISVRYLHQLFEMQGSTVCGWIRSQRLMMCDEALRDPTSRRSMSEIAYQWGFGDQAQFSRHYRAHFGRTPSDTRGTTRAGRSAAQR
ncbi:helix-turn-helix domain-containing protein [Chelatococcus reniformis]|uniref:AraC family transcriptional regulator n=1 Tax=Chelatococcus reniformis TaxID=1494448 RepID=A0A916X7H7_9HYPH|nr:helix-turn-helix domain-containing protein [Chelatococcus reniformis]GGC44963.1 AraC family transcriptional regulator [Chelatococcus reniformis]